MTELVIALLLAAGISLSDANEKGNPQHGAKVIQEGNVKVVITPGGNVNIIAVDDLGGG